MMPGVVISDPELTVGLPPAITAATGMDAFVHCFEAFCSPGFHPLADGIALEGLRLIQTYLPRACDNGKDIEARSRMLAAASMGATAFQKGLGGVHAIAHPVGAHFNTHHGLTNAVLLPYVIVHNRRAIESHLPVIARTLNLPGEPFAAATFGVTPDLITMAKALTNGAQPMGAVAVHDSIYRTVVDAAPDGAPEFFHGYTYSAHPAACAAGLATLEIYKSEQLFAKGRELSGYFLDAMFALQDLAAVNDVRGFGMLAGIEIKPGKAAGVRGNELQAKLFDRGLHVKTTGDVAIMAPAFIASRADIDLMGSILRDAIAEY